MKKLSMLLIASMLVVAPAHSMIKDAEVEDRIAILKSLEATKRILLQDNNIYAREPQSIKWSLERKHVMNEYWLKIETQSPEVKEAALKKILRLTFSDIGYPLLRYHIAAAVYAGANPNVEVSEIYASALDIAVLYEDLDLCSLLLEKGANPNTAHFGKPVLFDVYQATLAELFLQHGARVDVCYARSTLLHQVMAEPYSPLLIDLYKEKGLSPFYTDRNGDTPLGLLLFYAAGYRNVKALSRKVRALLDGLDQESIKKLIDISISDVLRQRTTARDIETLLRSSLALHAAL